MKISIWQQFSSNHSSSYSFVGRFESPERAKTALEAVQKALGHIAKWKAENRNLDDAIRAGKSPEKLTPPELEISNQYGIEWNTATIDWFDTGGGPSIDIVKNEVFFTVADESWSPSTGIVNLLRYFGGEIYYEDILGWGDSSHVHLTCNAPDEATAEEIENTLADDLLDEMVAMWSNLQTAQVASVQRRELHLTIEVVFELVGDALPPLVRYLEDEKGCTNVVYTITKVPTPDEDDELEDGEF